MIYFQYQIIRFSTKLSIFNLNLLKKTLNYLFLIKKIDHNIQNDVF